MSSVMATIGMALVSRWSTRRRLFRAEDDVRRSLDNLSDQSVDLVVANVEAIYDVLP
jgi:hypothetical protein